MVGRPPSGLKKPARECNTYCGVRRRPPACAGGGSGICLSWRRQTDLRPAPEDRSLPSRRMGCPPHWPMPHNLFNAPPCLEVSCHRPGVSQSMHRRGKEESYRQKGPAALLNMGGQFSVPVCPRMSRAWTAGTARSSEIIFAGEDEARRVEGGAKSSEIPPSCGNTSRSLAWWIRSADRASVDVFRLRIRGVVIRSCRPCTSCSQQQYRMYKGGMRHSIVVILLMEAACACNIRCCVSSVHGRCC